MKRTPQLGSGGLSFKLREIHESLRRTHPVANEYMAAEQTTGGLTWRPTDALWARIKTAGGIQEYTIASTDARELTADDGATILKPAKLKSLSDTRDDVGQTENWEPSHTTTSTRPTSPTYNYANEHYRWRIVHKSFALADGQAIDYLKILERLEPKYTANDVIYAAKFGGDWVDLNADGRRWVPVFQWNPLQYLKGPNEGIYANENGSPWPIMYEQDSTQIYGGAAAWLRFTDFTTLDVY